jgi:hypothetical protein
LSIDLKRGMYEGIVAPTLLYVSEVWAIGAAGIRRMEVMEIKCIRDMCGVSIMDKVRNEDVRRRCGSEVSIGERMDINVMRVYGYVERMEEERMVKSVYATVKGSRGREMSKKRWMDSGKANLESKRMMSKR